jgi:histidyl-tRNA synthetase
MGDVVMELVLRDASVIPEKLGNTPEVVVTVFDEDTLGESLKVAHVLREAGFKTVVYPEAEKLGKQFKYADRLDVPIAIVLGPDEIAAGQVAVKNLKTRDQVTIMKEELIDQVRAFLPLVA